MNYNSAIINLAFTLYQLFRNMFVNSVLYKLMAKAENWFLEKLDGSLIWAFLNKKGVLADTWECSLVYRFINWIVNALPQYLNRHFKRFEGILSDSRFFQYLKFLTDRFEAVAALGLVFIMLIPHQYWNNLYNTAIVLALAVLFAIKAIINKNQYFNIKALDYTLLIFIAAIVLAQVTSIIPKESLRFFIFYATCFLLTFVIVSGLKNEKSLGLFIDILLAGIAVTGLYAIYQRIRGIPMDPSLTDWVLNEGMEGRAYSTMGNANNYAELLIMTIPFFGAVILNAKSWLKKAAYAALLVPVLLALFLTGARSSWIALVIAVIVFVLMKDWKLLPLVAVIGVIGFALLPYISPSVYKRVLTIFTGTDTSINYRGLIYKTVEPMFRDFWLSGVGLGAGVEQAPFMKILQRYSLYYLINSSSSGYATTPPHTHNLYLQIWMEAGLIGIAAFVWFLVRTIKRTIINIFKKAYNSMSNMLIAGISALAGIMVMGMAEYVWFYPRIMLFFWVLAGIILSAVRISEDKAVKL